MSARISVRGGVPHRWTLCSRRRVPGQYLRRRAHYRRCRGQEPPCTRCRFCKARALPCAFEILQRVFNFGVCLDGLYRYQNPLNCLGDPTLVTKPMKLTQQLLFRHFSFCPFGKLQVEEMKKTRISSRQPLPYKVHAIACGACTIENSQKFSFRAPIHPEIGQKEDFRAVLLFKFDLLDSMLSPAYNTQKGRDWPKLVLVPYS